MTFEEAWNGVADIIQLSKPEAAKLFEFVQSLSMDAVIVEIGTWKCGSALLMAHTGRKIYTIDNFRTDQFNPGRPSEGEAKTKIKGFNIELIVGDSQEIAKTWDKPINLLFIDGNHFYEGVKADIESWVPHVIKEGLVCFHDYDSHRDVTKAVNEAIEKKIIGFDMTLLITRKYNV